VLSLITVYEERIVPGIEDLGECQSHQVRVIFDEGFFGRLHSNVTYSDSVFFAPCNILG